MKHIIIEGGDGLGKNSLIEGLCNHFNYDNIIIRHFNKPPKNMSAKETLDFQFEVFYKEILFVEHIRDNIDSDNLKYHDSTVIWNRSHLGEYVYAQMFRGISKKDVKTKIEKFENYFFPQLFDTYLITLNATPSFFLSKEDGQSFSQNLDQKSRELKLFKEIHRLSIIKNKRIIQVNIGKNYRGKDVILDEVLEFINLNIKN